MNRYLLRSPILVALVLCLSWWHPANAQQIDPPFEVAHPSRLDLLGQDNAWVEMASKAMIGLSLYETAETVAEIVLGPDERYANEFALLLVFGVAAGAEATSWFRANNDDGVSVKAKRTDSWFDAMELSAWAIQDYVGAQFGTMPRVLTAVAMLAVDWHFLPERDLRR